MKYYEATDFFLRVIVMDFVHKAKFNNYTFRLIPMFHIGEQAFYNNVIKEMNLCDKVLYEGAYIKRRRIHNQIGRYTKIASALGLVSQYKALNIAQVESELIHTDIDLSRGIIEWKKLKLYERLRYRFIQPIQYYYDTQHLTKSKLVRRFMEGANEAYLAYGPRHDVPGTLENLIHEVRDNIIIKRISSLINEELEGTITIGILFGASHMKKVGRFLIDSLGFKPTNAKFIKVFDT